MDYLSHNVSENLKRIRQSKGMSLDQVAEQISRAVQKKTKARSFVQQSSEVLSVSV